MTMEYLLGNIRPQENSIMCSIAMFDVAHPRIAFPLTYLMLERCPVCTWYTQCRPSFGVNCAQLTLGSTVHNAQLQTRLYGVIVQIKIHVTLPLAQLAIRLRSRVPTAPRLLTSLPSAPSQLVTYLHISGSTSVLCSSLQDPPLGKYGRHVR